MSRWGGERHDLEQIEADAVAQEDELEDRADEARRDRIVNARWPEDLTPRAPSGARTSPGAHQTVTTTGAGR